MTSVKFGVVDPESTIARRCVVAYFGELNQRFGASFDGIDPEADLMRAPDGAFVVATREGEPLGCGGVKFSGTWAEVKRVWVSPNSRGLGVGRGLMDSLAASARDAGCKVVRLDTNAGLTEAVAMYHRLGYHEIAAYNDNPHAHHWFEKALL